MRHSSKLIKGVRYAYLEAGDGPLLLLAHGTFGGKELMRPQLDHLSQWFHCVALDWPGHGESGFNPNGWNADDLVENVVELINGFGEDSAFLAGVSQGGAIFSRVTLAYPERVRALVNMCGGPGEPPPAALARVNDLARLLAEETDETIRRREASLFASSYYHGPGFAEREPKLAELEVNLLLNQPVAALKLLPGVPASYKSILEQLSQITCPVLIIWGDRDLRPSLGAEVAAATPGAQLVVIEGGGHHVNVDAPTQTSVEIEKFFRSVLQRE